MTRRRNGLAFYSNYGGKNKWQSRNRWEWNQPSITRETGTLTPVLGCQQMTDNVGHLQHVVSIWGIQLSYTVVCIDQICTSSRKKARKRQKKCSRPHSNAKLLFCTLKVSMHAKDALHCLEVGGTLRLLNAAGDINTPLGLWGLLHKANIVFISLTLYSETSAKESNSIMTSGQRPLSPSLPSTSMCTQSMAHTDWAHKVAGGKSLPPSTGAWLKCCFINATATLFGSFGGVCQPRMCSESLRNV